MKNIASLLAVLSLSLQSFAIQPAGPVQEEIQNCSDAQCRENIIMDVLVGLKSIKDANAVEATLNDFVASAEWMFQNGVTINAEDILTAAVRNGDIEDRDKEIILLELAKGDSASIESFQSAIDKMEVVPGFGGTPSSYKPKAKTARLGVGLSTTAVFAFLATFSGQGYLVPFLASGYLTGRYASED